MAGAIRSFLERLLGDSGDLPAAELSLADQDLPDPVYPRVLLIVYDPLPPSAGGRLENLLAKIVSE